MTGSLSSFLSRILILPSFTEIAIAFSDKKNVAGQFGLIIFL